MASPFIEGTKAASAISSRHVDILHESIFIQIDENFHTAKYKVEYTIKSDVVGKQIPLLFCAVDYKDDFCVWLDDRPVKVFDIPFKKEEGEEKEDIEVYVDEQSTPIGVMQECILKGMDRRQAIEFCMKRFKLTQKELLDEMTRYLEQKKKIRTDKDGNVYLGDDR